MKSNPLTMFLKCSLYSQIYVKYAIKGLNFMLYNVNAKGNCVKIMYFHRIMIVILITNMKEN